jgi:hypothetical protein
MRKLLILLLLVAPVHVRAAETLSQLIADVRALTLDGASSTRQKFTDSQITTFLNQGQREMMQMDRCLENSIIFTLVPGTTYYPLPNNYNNIDRVTIGSKWLQQLSVGALDGRSRGWEASSGYPTYYFINISSRGLVGFAPWPAQSTDTDTVKIEYSIQATDLVNSSDLPFNGVNELQDFHHALAYWAAATISNIMNQPERSTYYMSLYQYLAKKFDSSCREQPAYSPSGAATP